MYADEVVACEGVTLHLHGRFRSDPFEGREMKGRTSRAKTGLPGPAQEGNAVSPRSLCAEGGPYYSTREGGGWSQWLTVLTMYAAVHCSVDARLTSRLRSSTMKIP